MHEPNKKSSSTTDRQQRSANYKDHNHPAWQQASVVDKHLWTLVQSTKEKASTTVTKEKAKEKERTKAKATGDTTATGTTITTPITKEKESMEEKDSTTTTTVRSASAIHSGEATKETKDSAKDTTKAKERTKENKRQTHATDVDEQGHYAKDCRVAIHNIGQGESNDIEDTTAQWYDDYYDNGWYFQDYTRQQQGQQPLALPPIPSTSNHDMTPIHVIAMISNGNDHKSDYDKQRRNRHYTHHDRQWSSHTFAHYGLQTTIQCTRSTKHKAQTSGQ